MKNSVRRSSNREMISWKFGWVIRPDTTGWTVQGSNPGGSGIFRTLPDWPWGPPSLLYSGYQVFFLRVKRPERGVDHLSPSSAEVKEIVEIYL